MPVLGSPSQKYSGVITLNELQAIEARVAALEEALGIGKKIVSGTSTVVWSVKSKTSSEKSIITGLSVITGVFLQIVNLVGTVGDVTGIAGGNFSYKFYVDPEELPAGTERTFYWFAIGE